MSYGNIPNRPKFESGDNERSCSIIGAVEYCNAPLVTPSPNIGYIPSYHIHICHIVPPYEAIMI